MFNKSIKTSKNRQFYQTCKELFTRLRKVISHVPCSMLAAVIMIANICTTGADDSKKSVCKRLSDLDITAVTTASGLPSDLAQALRKVIKEYSLSIADTSLENKNLIDGADNIETKVKNFKNAVSSRYNVIFATRGGYGATHLPSKLNDIPRPTNRKTFIGFSDNTSLNLFISQKWKHWRVIHGPMMVNLVDGFKMQNGFTRLLDILENKINHYDISPLTPLNNPAKTAVSVSGKLTGGNLSLIQASLKTCWEMDAIDKIVFIEDTGSNVKSLYRTLCHLQEAGMFAKAKAVIFGYFKGMDYRYIPRYLKHFAERLNIPVYITDQFGHGDYNMPLIYNAQSEIKGKNLRIFVDKF